METKNKFVIEDGVVELTHSDFNDVLQKYLKYYKTHPKVTDQDRNTFLREIFAKYLVA